MIGAPLWFLARGLWRWRIRVHSLAVGVAVMSLPDVLDYGVVGAASGLFWKMTSNCIYGR
jgi:hypothetical protein